MFNPHKSGFYVKYVAKNQSFEPLVFSGIVLGNTAPPSRNEIVTYCPLAAQTWLHFCLARQPWEIRSDSSKQSRFSRNRDSSSYWLFRVGATGGFKGQTCRRNIPSPWHFWTLNRRIKATKHGRAKARSQKLSLTMVAPSTNWPPVNYTGQFSTEANVSKTHPKKLLNVGQGLVLERS